MIGSEAFKIAIYMALALTEAFKPLLNQHSQLVSDLPLITREASLSIINDFSQYY